MFFRYFEGSRCPYRINDRDSVVPQQCGIRDAGQTPSSGREVVESGVEIGNAFDSERCLHEEGREENGHEHR